VVIVISISNRKIAEKIAQTKEMKSYTRTILCWILTISLVWLPLTAQANFSQSEMGKDSCHEMMSVESSHIDKTVAMNDFSKNKVVASHNCNHCDESCDCDTNVCTHPISHTFSFIVSNQYFYHHVHSGLVQAEHTTLYHSQIVSPNFRPPVV
jgi:hypothetical protein